MSPMGPNQVSIYFEKKYLRQFWGIVSSQVIGLCWAKDHENHGSFAAILYYAYIAKQNDTVIWYNSA